MTGSAEFIHDKQCVADVNTNCTLEVRFKNYITAHRLPVSVERQPDQLAGVWANAAAVSAISVW